MTRLLALLLLLSLPLFAMLLQGKERNRLWAFAAIAALPFCSNLPITGYLYGWFPFYGIVIGFGVALMDILAAALIFSRRKALRKLPFWPIFALYGITLLLSIFSSPRWIATTFVWWQFARMLLLFAAVGGEAYRPEVRQFLIFGWAIGLIYQAANVFIQKLNGVVQASGTFGHQNILGLAIELSILPLIGAYLAGNRSKFIPIGIVSALICVAGSGSRATVGLVGVSIVGLVTISLIRRLTPHKTKAVAFAVVGIAIASPFAIATLNSRFDGASFVTEEEGRLAFEKAAAAMAEDHPIGVGANQSVYVSNQNGYAERAGVSWRFQDRSVPVHNAYLLARAETGWLGQIAFFLMLAVPAFFAFRLAFANRNWPGGELLLGCGMAIVTNMVHNNYEFATHTAPIMSLLFINFGIIAALWRVEKGRKRKPLRRPSGRREAVEDDARVPEPVAFRST